jgi:hypothetical protein
LNKVYIKAENNIINSKFYKTHAYQRSVSNIAVSHIICITVSSLLSSVFAFFFFMRLVLELRASHLQSKALYHLSHISSSFCSDYFGDGVSQTVCLGCPPTTILPISACQIVRITGVGHWCSASFTSYSKTCLNQNGLYNNFAINKCNAKLCWI